MKEDTIEELANTAVDPAQLERIAVAVDYLGFNDQPTMWTAELLQQKRARMQYHLEHLRALADESRLDIMLFLMHTGGKDGQPLQYTVSEIAERFKISMSTVSHHLQELKRVGIVRMERNGKERVYQADLDYIITQVEALYTRLLKKRELLRQGISGCPTELLVEFLTKNKPESSAEATE